MGRVVSQPDATGNARERARHEAQFADDAATAILPAPDSGPSARAVSQLQRHLQDRLLAALQGLGLPRAQAEPLVVLQPPKNREHGDTALGAFQLAKALGKAPPQLATELAAAITAATCAAR